MDQKNEYVGHINCTLCGNLCGVKKSKTGRFTAVCKWQDGGCGSQLQTLTADSGMLMIHRMKITDKPEQESEAAKPEHVESESKSESTGPSAWGLV